MSTTEQNAEATAAAVKEWKEGGRAARGWLLLAAEDPAKAVREWEEVKAALLTCGRTFTVVKMQPEVVWAAAGTQRMADVDAYLAQALHDGPVFVTLYPHRYYALVPVKAAERYEWMREQTRTDAKLLGRGLFVAVPEPDRVEPDGARAYWSVPLREVGNLCSADAVSQMLAHGRYNLTLKEGGE